MKVDTGISTPLPQQQQQQQQQQQLAFGVPLEGLMPRGSVALPRPIRECIAYLRHHGIATEGLFRRSPPSTVLRAAKDAYNRDQPVDLELGGVHVAAVLLKLFFRELPDPIFSLSSYATIRALPASMTVDNNNNADVAKQMDSVRARYVEEVVLASLTNECRLLLCFTCALLAIVARNEEANRMSAFNLAIVWAPNLARSANPVADVAMCSAGPSAATVGSAIQIMVSCFDSVFAKEIAIILKGKATDDRVVAVLDVVDRMNEEEGIEASSPVLPPRAKSVEPGI
ncbi:hypothetical protein H4S07_002361 [Coemansia furcata]|uniref:Uncharacterized protein n=1 Tax=Coemansia furcata TaxID=417177 RepID=A0ACC1LKR9_9FUNG|nr:hypothetical protein H4S07_002361 [Coemansia furcata]